MNRLLYPKFHTNSHESNSVVFLFTVLNNVYPFEITYLQRVPVHERASHFNETGQTLP